MLLQVVQCLLRVVDRRRGDAEHLVAACPAHRIDAAEAAAMAKGELGGVRTRAQVLGHLQLPLALDHLEHERQAGNEPDHRHEPRRAAVRGNERLDIGQAVDPRGILQVGAARVLVAVTKTHQRFMGPGVVVQHWNLDDPRLQRALGHRLRFGTAHRLQQCLRRDTVRVEADLERGVGQAHIQHAIQGQPLHRTGDGHALEKSLQRHALADFGKQVLVGAKAVADRGCSKRFGHDCSFSWNLYRKAGENKMHGLRLVGLPDA
ncbi:hypothetical protein D3C78_1097990 [compost metagenome]